MARRMLAAGNWKMNGTAPMMAEFVAMLGGANDAGCDVLICPPFPMLSEFARLAGGTAMGVGAQDCHASASGAHTGDVSAEMVAATGASAVIVGHSERRTDHGETDAAVHAKTEAAWRAGLTAIICVGETEAQRDSGGAVDVVTGQLAGSVPDGATPSNTVIAYEPVWAIGTGRTPSADDVQQMHGAMRSALRTRFGDSADGMRLLYGGSVKAANAAEFFALEDVDGALVGGASLKAQDFLPIVAAAAAVGT